MTTDEEMGFSSFPVRTRDFSQISSLPHLRDLPKFVSEPSLNSPYTVLHAVVIYTVQFFL